jgi:predicted secreted Zn-dependent protease
VSATIAAPANGREEANRKKRIAQELLAQSKKQNRQRRLIDVSKSEMSPAGDVIKLIAKITVAPVCQQMDQQRRHAEHSD